MSGDPKLVEILSGQDPLSADISPADRTLLSYAIKLTTSPAEVRQTDISALRQAGFGERAIHDACVVVAYFAYVNRVADGLGVGLEGAG